MCLSSGHLAPKSEPGAARDVRADTRRGYQPEQGDRGGYTQPVEKAV